ncbi:MAG: hypothetical protein HeimC2_04130 [Candidatus Heimdallarchaeota archaeon LC_2]|nr:MAG: hypothetical protein HeimC2_04130 [Candidatus Heimdallarchaeota archaeon LC_2]
MIYSDEKIPDVVFLNVTVKPGSKEQKLTRGIDELVVHLKSSPIKGKANKELVVFLSKIFGIKKNQLTIVKGLKNRNKIVQFLDITQDSILTILEFDLKD